MILLTKCSFGTQPKDGISGKDGISDDNIAGDECIYIIILAIKFSVLAHRDFQAQSLLMTFIHHVGLAGQVLYQHMAMAWTWFQFPILSCRHQGKAMTISEQSGHKA